MAKDPAVLLKKGGIYNIHFTNNPTDLYIGSAINFSERKIRHKHHLKKQIHKNIHLQRIYNKYGCNSFVFEVIEVVDDFNLLIEREQYYINTLNSTLNILRLAGNCIGFRHDESTKEYLSSINKGKRMTAEQNVRNSIAQMGNKNASGAIRSIEFKKKLSLIKQKKVINTQTGTVFNSIGDAADSIGINYNTLYAKLSGININNTNLSLL